MDDLAVLCKAWLYDIVPSDMLNTCLKSVLSILSRFSCDKAQ